MRVLKVISVIFLIAFAFFGWHFSQEFSCVKPHNFEHLLDAIEWVESKGNINAIGDNGKAVGCMQIHKIYVDDVNRILGRNKYTYANRKNRDKSREMVKIYLTYYASKIGRKPTYEDMARIHNGGPNGYKKLKTLWYWFKVKARLKENDYEEI